MNQLRACARSRAFPRRAAWLLAVVLLVTLMLAGCRPPAPAQPYRTRLAQPAAPAATSLPALPAQTAVKPPAQPSGAAPLQTSAPSGTRRIAPDDGLIVYVPSEGNGEIAVLISLPKKPRYSEGAGIVIEIPTFFTPAKGFSPSLEAASLGLIQVNLLLPGRRDPRSGASSSGSDDYGGENGIRAIADVVRFAAGQIPDRDGHYLADLSSIPPLSTEIGLYAFSHPGIAAVNLLASHGGQLPPVGYLVGRENPTTDAISAVEIGHFDDSGRPVYNPLYSYPQSYTPQALQLDYSRARWDPDFREPSSQAAGRPYFDLDSDGRRSAGDYVLSYRVPTIYGKRTYSTALTAALQASGSIPTGAWPADLATPEEAAALWPARSSPAHYADLVQRVPNLKVMLVFARQDHIQPAIDKPHIHHAWDGLAGAGGLWTRLNPDQAYILSFNPTAGRNYSEHPANTAPSDWLQIESWAYAGQGSAARLVPLAAVAEMADRLHTGNWAPDLAEILVQFSVP